MTPRIYEQAVTPAARRALEVLGPLPVLRDFYLAGGTGLALQEGHRVSVDLDFFSARNALDFASREAVKGAIRAQCPLRVREEKDGTLHLDLEETAVSFFRYSYPLLKRTVGWRGVRIARPEDIGLMKLAAVAGRGSKKDFLDLYVICRRLPLSKLFTSAGRKFRDSKDFALEAARALVYFDDADREPTPKVLKPVDWPAVKEYFRRETPRAVRALLAS